MRTSKTFPTDDWTWIMVKVICHLYPMIRAENEEERIALRPIGRNRGRYQDALMGMNEIVRAADDLGLWGVSTIEHHFHSEGYEVAPNPGLINAYWASQVHRVRIGNIGYSLTAQNPIRVAEDTAILDHMTQGRSFVGFSRGYQSRWTQILGQHYGAKATTSPSGLRGEAYSKVLPDDLDKYKKDDEINREIFEEHIDIVLKAWTESSLRFKGRHWEIPFPYETGVEWPMHSTGRLGAPGELDDQGRVQRVSVVPAPFTDPHPPVFVASNTSPETIEYCAEHGFIPTYFTKVERARELGELYVKTAAECGRTLALGQNQASVRWLQIADTAEEARSAVEEYDVEIYRNFMTQLTPIPYDEKNPVQALMGSGLWAAGNVSEVVEEFRRQWKELPSEYVVLIFHYAQMPADVVIKNLELFMQHVKPVLDEMTEFEGVPAALASDEAR